MGLMTERRIRVDTELMAKIIRLTEGKCANTYTARLRYLISEVEQSRKPTVGHECRGVTKGEMEKILEDLRRGY